MHRAENVKQIRERVNDATGIEVPKPEHPSVCTTGVVRKDRLDRGATLRCRTPLFAGKTRDPHHADLAVGPRLVRDPFDHAVMVTMLLAIATFRLVGPSLLSTYAHITIAF